MFLKTRTKDEIRLVYQGDPAVDTGDPTEDQVFEWVEKSEAKMKSGEKPDVMVCRPLNADEILRIVDAVDRDKSFIVYAAQLSVIKIEMGNGEVLKDPQKVTSVLNDGQNMEAVCALSQKVFDMSRGGEESLPFHTESDGAG